MPGRPSPSILPGRAIPDSWNGITDCSDWVALYPVCKNGPYLSILIATITTLRPSDLRNPIPAVTFVARSFSRHSPAIINHPFTAISRYEQTGRCSQANVATWYICCAIIVGALSRARHRTISFAERCGTPLPLSRFAFPCHEHATHTFAVKTWQHYWHRVHTAVPVVTEPATHFIFLFLMIACFGRLVVALWIG
jgi:hypothetical protein